MKSKTKRVILWGICLVISVIVIAFNQYNESLPKIEQGPKVNNVYNDIEKEGLVKEVFDNALASKKKVTFVTDTDYADCILTKNVNVLEDEDNKITLTSYTPLVIVMKNSTNLKKYQDSGLLISSKEIDNSAEDEISIDFKKVIDAVVNGENWSTFGGEEKEIKIIVPKKDSIEGGLFYSFLVATINGGSYPQNNEAINAAKATANKFWNSSSCVEAENSINDLSKISVVNETDMYVLFEADLMNSTAWNANKLDMSIAYPTTTVVKHIYMQSEEDCGELFNSLSMQLNYRTSNTHSFAENTNYNVKDSIEFIEVLVEVFSTSGIEDFSIMIVIILLILIVIVIGVPVIAVILS